MSWWRRWRVRRWHEFGYELLSDVYGDCGPEKSDEMLADEAALARLAGEPAFAELLDRARTSR